MNLQKFIEEKKFLNFPQEVSLIEILSFRARGFQAEHIKQLVRNNFFSTFDGQAISKLLEVRDSEITFSGTNADIKKFRTYIKSL